MLDSWQKRERSHTRTCVYNVYIVSAKCGICIADGIAKLTSTIISIYKSITYKKITLVFKICGYKKQYILRVPTHPQKTDLMAPRTSSYIGGISKNFFPKIIGA
jgi:hypothetical protein